jgi:hypothetical protein
LYGVSIGSPLLFVCDDAHGRSVAPFFLYATLRV